MRIHSTSHDRYFTVVSNEPIRRHELSFTARGILVYLLSLPDGAREDVRTLARKSREGRVRVSAALKELEATGYYVRTVERGEDGQVRTRVDVYEAPAVGAQAGSPVPVKPVVGESAVGKAGTQPKVESTKAKHLPPSPMRDESKPQEAPRAPRAGREEESAQTTPTSATAAAVLARVSRVDARLTLGAAETMKLAPLVETWIARGADERRLHAVLTTGLPATVHNAAALVKDRLTRKMPAELPTPVAAPARFECTECKAPTTRAGLCSRHDDKPATVPAAVNAAIRGAALIREQWRTGVALA